MVQFEMAIIVDCSEASRRLTYNGEGDYNAAFLIFDEVELLRLDFDCKFEGMSYPTLTRLIGDRNEHECCHSHSRESWAYSVCPSPVCTGT